MGLPPTALGPHAVALGATRHPGRVAVRHADGPALTYAELDERARRCATALHRLGCGEGTHVATLVHNGFDGQGIWLGLGWLRAIEVPLNTELKGALLRHALRASEARILVTTSEFLTRVAEVEDALPALERVVVVDGMTSELRSLRVEVDPLPDLADVEPANGLEGPSYRDIAALLFTSGTTGPAKAVLTPWAVIYQNWSWVPADAAEPGEGVYCAMPLFHNSGRAALNGAMVRGLTFVFREKFSAERFWDDVKNHECRAASLVGPMTALLHSRAEREDDADNPLRAILCGPLIREIDDFERRFGLRVATGFGQTEIGMALVTDWNHGPWSSCGRERLDYPRPEVRVVDEHDQPLGPGEVGELVVRSPEPWALNAGYFELPEATARAWRNGWFHTGDAFRYDEQGWFYLVDRMNDAIRRRGENISSFEVEELVGGHPEVVECAAVAEPAELGEDEVRIVVVVRDPDSFEPAALLAWLEPRMPRYMWPRYVEPMKALPRNETTGRIKKHELRAMGLGPDCWDREKWGSRSRA
ncbi:AMP-binding protein [Myxococcota bacterium]|nr:AMP-binding protein [Myxococcota bacterium]